MYSLIIVYRQFACMTFNLQSFWNTADIFSRASQSAAFMQCWSSAVRCQGLLGEFSLAWGELCSGYCRLCFCLLDQVSNQSDTLSAIYTFISTLDLGGFISYYKKATVLSAGRLEKWNPLFLFTCLASGIYRLWHYHITDFIIIIMFLLP